LTLKPLPNCIPAALALALAVAPAAAQQSEPPVTETAPNLVLEALGQTVTFPAPDWLSEEEQRSDEVRPLVEMLYRTQGSQAVLEIMPKGETEALWNTLYGVQVSTETTKPLTRIRAEVVARYASTCQPQATAFFQLGNDEGETLAPLGFACGAYRNDLTGFLGKGEVMIMTFRKNEAGVALVFQEWRGAAFDPTKPDTWPVATEVVEARAQQLQEVVAAGAD
jgi:hypothetical protein